MFMILKMTIVTIVVIVVVMMSFDREAARVVSRRRF